MASILRVKYENVTLDDQPPQVEGDKPGHQSTYLAIEGFGPHTILGAVRDLMHPEHRNSNDAKVEKIEIIPNWDGQNIWGEF